MAYFLAFLTMIKQIYCKDVKFSDYSLSHRHNSHAAIAMMDVDKVATCIGCNKPLLLAETAKHRGPREDYFKGHSMIKQLAEMSGLNAYLIWYKVNKSQVDKIYVKKVFPKYSKLQNCTWEEWVSFLASFQVKHYPDCPRKDIFMNKVNSLTFEQKKDYAEILLG